jgi:hypothetical protein
METEPLRRAIETYWEARQEVISGIPTKNQMHRLVLRGFSDRSSKKELLESLQEFASRKNLAFRSSRWGFRPDVAYRIDGNFGIFSGLQIELAGRQGDFSTMAEHALSMSERYSGFTLDQYFVSYSDESALVNFALRNLGEFLGLLESCADLAMARAICSRLVGSEESLITRRSDVDLAKLFLIADLPLPNGLLTKGWVVAQVAKLGANQIKNQSKSSILGKSGSQSARTSDSPAIDMAGPEVTHLKNVLVFTGDVLMEGGRLLALDDAANPAFSFVAGRYGVVVGTHANIHKSAVLVPDGLHLFIPEGILLSSRADTNWFHWLIETLPKLLFMETMAPKNVPVIISERIPNSAKESVKLLTDRKIIEVSPSTATRVGKLYVASPVLFHPDPAELHLNPITNRINLGSLVLLRERILSKAKQSMSGTSSSQSIYIARSSGSRSLVNSRRVATTLRRFGFVVHDPANMSFLEQVVAFHSAKRIVLVGGASMANLIFCSEGAAVVALRSKFTDGYKMPEILAGVAGARVLSVSGRPVGNAFRTSYLEKVHAHYQVGIRALSKAVRRIL